MDTTTIATSLLSMQAQTQAASTSAILIKNDLDSQKAIAQLLTSSTESSGSQGALAPGVGGNLDVSV